MRRNALRLGHLICRVATTPHSHSARRTYTDSPGSRSGSGLAHAAGHCSQRDAQRVLVVPGHGFAPGPVGRLVAQRPEAWTDALISSAHWLDYSVRNQVLLASYGADGPVAGSETWRLVPSSIEGRPCAVRAGEHGNIRFGCRSPLGAPSPIPTWGDIARPRRRWSGGSGGRCSSSPACPPPQPRRPRPWRTPCDAHRGRCIVAAWSPAAGGAQQRRAWIGRVSRALSGAVRTRGQPTFSGDCQGPVPVFRSGSGSCVSLGRGFRRR